ncbi:MAG: hypothetical protein HY432_01320 [Candidatus Liptonbacteria bacterium]|nr:hypothetical protein [Candidatus Liptonbacteria bacterium]
MNMWKQWVNVVLGVLVAIMTYSTSMTVAILGILVAVVALWSALEKRGM